MNKLFILTLTLPILATYSNAVAAIGPSNAQNDIAGHIGWLHGNCLAIRNAELPLNAEINLVRLDSPQTIGTGRITERATSGDKCYPLLEDRRDINVGNGYSFYLIATKPTINLAIGVFEQKIDTGVNTYDYCMTTEGIKFSISHNHQVLWSGYYYLGYDSEPTCQDHQD